MDAQKSGKEKSGKAKRKIAARNRKAELRSPSAALAPGAESAGPAPAGPLADRAPHPESTLFRTWTAVNQMPPRMGGVSGSLPDSCSCNGAFEVKSMLRQAFSDFLCTSFGWDLNKALIQWGIHSVCDVWSQKFPTADEKTRLKFSSFKRGRGFSGMITDVMTEDCYARMETRLLKLLLEAAKTFSPQKSRLLASRAEEMTWSGSLGNQYFVLCKNIVEWNRTTFHPDLSSKDNMEQMKRLREQAAFTVEGINVENLVTGLLLR